MDPAEVSPSPARHSIPVAATHALFPGMAKKSGGRASSRHELFQPIIND
jgi:hypothetical protein